jgi:hypothetical protein
MVLDEQRVCYEYHRLIFITKKVNLVVIKCGLRIFYPILHPSIMSKSLHTEA